MIICPLNTSFDHHLQYRDINVYVSPIESQQFDFEAWNMYSVNWIRLKRLFHYVLRNSRCLFRAAIFNAIPMPQLMPSYNPNTSSRDFESLQKLGLDGFEFIRHNVIFIECENLTNAEMYSIQTNTDTNIFYISFITGNLIEKIRYTVSQVFIEILNIYVYTLYNMLPTYLPTPLTLSLVLTQNTKLYLSKTQCGIYFRHMNWAWSCNSWYWFGSYSCELGWRKHQIIFGSPVKSSFGWIAWTLQNY